MLQSKFLLIIHFSLSRRHDFFVAGAAAAAARWVGPFGESSQRVTAEEQRKLRMSHDRLQTRVGYSP
jgi:hypothetical protein